MPAKSKVVNLHAKVMKNPSLVLKVTAFTPIAKPLNGSLPSSNESHLLKLQPIPYNYKNGKEDKATEAQAYLIKGLRGLSDKSWTVSVPAAEAFGPIGLQTLQSAVLAAPDALAIRAIAALRRIGSEEALRVIDGALASQRDEVVAAAAEAAGNLRREETLPMLCELVTSGRSAKVRAVAATALGRIGSPSAREPLLQAFRIPERQIRLAVLTALGQCGSVEDVPGLLDLESDVDAAVRRAARQAIASIQKRLGHAEKGWVSMAEQQGLEGAVSVVEAGGPGSLSLDQDNSAGARTPGRGRVKE